MNYFTADTHYGDPRIGVGGQPNLFYRPFKSLYEQNLQIFRQFMISDFKDGDTLWHLGDVCYDITHICNIEKIRDEFPNSKFNLIVGNYDENHLGILHNYFDSIHQSMDVRLGDNLVYLNHYPINCQKNMGDCDFAITGHIHGLWKVQPKMINVGVDAWHFKPVSETEILFCWNAMKNFYDENVFLPK